MARRKKKLSVKEKAGRKGGNATLRRKGRDWYRKIAGMRKTFGGGRPPKAKAA